MDLSKYYKQENDSLLASEFNSLLKDLEQLDKVEVLLLDVTLEFIPPSDLEEGEYKLYICTNDLSDISGSLVAMNSSLVTLIYPEESSMGCFTGDIIIVSKVLNTIKAVLISNKEAHKEGNIKTKGLMNYEDKSNIDLLILKAFPLSVKVLGNNSGLFLKKTPQTPQTITTTFTATEFNEDIVNISKLVSTKDLTFSSSGKTLKATITVNEDFESSIYIDRKKDERFVTTLKAQFVYPTYYGISNSRKLNTDYSSGTPVHTINLVDLTEECTLDTTKEMDLKNGLYAYFITPKNVSLLCRELESGMNAKVTGVTTGTTTINGITYYFIEVPSDREWKLKITNS